MNANNKMFVNELVSGNNGIFSTKDYHSNVRIYQLALNGIAVVFVSDVWLLGYYNVILKVLFTVAQRAIIIVMFINM